MIRVSSKRSRSISPPSRRCVDRSTAATNSLDSRSYVVLLNGRWLLTSQAEPEDRELGQLAHRMFAADPDLGALRTADGSRSPGRRGHDRGRHRPPSRRRRPLLAAAAAAIAMEIIDTEPGTDREQAVAAAMRFLEAGTAAL